MKTLTTYEIHFYKFNSILLAENAYLYTLLLN